MKENTNTQETVLDEAMLDETIQTMIEQEEGVSCLIEPKYDVSDVVTAIRDFSSDSDDSIQTAIVYQDNTSGDIFCEYADQEDLEDEDCDLIFEVTVQPSLLNVLYMSIDSYVIVQLDGTLEFNEEQLIEDYEEAISQQDDGVFDDSDWN